VAEFEAAAMKDQLNDKNTLLFSLDGTVLKGDAKWANTFNAQKEDAINWIHFGHGEVEGLEAAKNDRMTQNLEQHNPSKPREPSDREIQCFRWLVSRAEHRHEVNGSAKVDHIEKKVQKVCQSAGLAQSCEWKRNTFVWNWRGS
jgi:hypothetical protein